MVIISLVHIRLIDSRNVVHVWLCGMHLIAEHDTIGMINF